MRTILYLPGWLIGARARRRERDPAMRPREVGMGNQRAYDQTGDTQSQVGSSLAHHTSRGVLSTLWRLGADAYRTQAQAVAPPLQLELT